MSLTNCHVCVLFCLCSHFCYVRQGPHVCAGQWLLPALLGALRSDLTMDLLGHWQRLYEDHARDAGDTVLAAFQAGNFTKVPFSAFSPCGIQ